jgi:hypothetical protein
MATIEELLKQDTKHLKDMNQQELEVYLKDIVAMEPKPLPKPLGSEDKKVEEEDDGCPIKERKPRKKTTVKISKEEQAKSLLNEDPDKW